MVLGAYIKVHFTGLRKVKVMDYSGVAVTVQANVNLVENASVKKQAPKEVENVKVAAPAQDIVETEGMRERMKAYEILSTDMESNESPSPTQEAVAEQTSTVENLIGKHPLYPFNKTSMDVYSEYIKKASSGDFKITGDLLEKVGSQIEQVKSNIGEVKPAAAEQAAQKTGAARDLTEVI
jgi:hypothetical protein